MVKEPITISITGAAGQIGYSLVFRLATGELFGKDQPINLNLIEIPSGMDRLNGLIMELEDCAFPLVKNIIGTTNLEEGFKDTNWALLVGSVPRKAGMERKDLLNINGKIFISQGKAISDFANRDVRILVVGNPCNTNCLIAMSNSKNIPSDRWFAMTMLDENRAKAQLSLKSATPVKHISNMIIWGNHSSTQYPDFYNSLIKDTPTINIIDDMKWLQNDFIEKVQKRGAEIISAKGSSSAASAASAIIDTVKNIITPTPKNQYFSLCIISDGSYDISPGLISSMPCRSDGEKITVFKGLTLNKFSREKITQSIQELLEEKEAIKDLLN